MKIEIGSGYNPTAGFVHCDINPHAPDVDVVCDMLHLPFADNSATELRAVDCLEHASYRETDRLLAEWARVLAPGGRIYIQTPDAESMIHWYLSRPAHMITDEFADHPPIVSLAWRLLGGHADGERVSAADDYRWNAHYALFSRESLTWYLNRAGLTVESIARNPFPNLLCWATKAA